MVNKFVENITSPDQSIYSVVSDYTPYYTADDNKHRLDGVVRTNHGGLEYYDADCGAWFTLPGQETTVEISPHYQTVLNWAMDKMLKEQQEQELMEKYPALKNAKQNYETVKAMVEND